MGGPQKELGGPGGKEGTMRLNDRAAAQKPALILGSERNPIDKDILSSSVRKVIE